MRGCPPPWMVGLALLVRASIRSPLVQRRGRADTASGPAGPGLTVRFLPRTVPGSFVEEQSVDFELPPNVAEFRQELREFLVQEWPPERRARMAVGDNYEAEREFRRKLARKGWLAMSWPKEYGGQGRSILEQYIFSEEMAYHGAPAGTVGVGQVGPTLM